MYVRSEEKIRADVVDAKYIYMHVHIQHMSDDRETATITMYERHSWNIG